MNKSFVYILGLMAVLISSCTDQASTKATIGPASAETKELKTSETQHTLDLSKYCIGNWRDINSGDLYYFFEDGDFLLKKISKNNSSAGTWVNINNNTIKLRFSGLGVTEISVVNAEWNFPGYLILREESSPREGVLLEREETVKTQINRESLFGAWQAIVDDYIDRAEFLEDGTMNSLGFQWNIKKGEFLKSTDSSGSWKIDNNKLSIEGDLNAHSILLANGEELVIAWQNDAAFISSYHRIANMNAALPDGEDIIKRQKSQAKDISDDIRKNLRFLVMAAQQYILETGEKKVSYGELVPLYLSAPKPVNGESYLDIEFTESQKILSVTDRDGILHEYEF